ncbi:hypothetical protein CKM354_000769700 [Cercospora kikuchii]|uniref:Uncharacterized protein n=1 Tax=Cercospora kikuchii TaxID=84275 RepID=A0A9P3CRM6_9PEZI|nr:uncharacterized protein CKM354_000769700 [Cercospora kikuchii]GIZ44500.1 hypothetical protein CKM354_000769700 [Cercospora kikuchii]
MPSQNTNQVAKPTRASNKTLFEAQHSTSSDMTAATGEVTKNDMASQAEHFTDQATLPGHLNHEFSIAANAPQPSFRQPYSCDCIRRQFVAELARFAAQKYLVPRGSFNQPMPASTFNPFGVTFLNTAPETTVALIAKLCCEAVAKTTILTIPAELRLRIYQYAIERHWKEDFGSYNSLDIKIWPSSGAVTKKKKRNRPLGPPITRTCKLFREEGIVEYRNFLRTFYDIYLKQQDDKMRLAAADSQRYEAEFLKPYLRPHLMIHCGRPVGTHPKDIPLYKALDAKIELGRLEKVKEPVAKVERKGVKAR